VSNNIIKATSTEELKKYPGFPSEDRFKRGMVAVIECDQEIPCNPCEDACPNKSIVVGHPITNLPIMREETCSGCGLCVAGCPGQAIFMVNKVYSEKEDLVGIPYEYIPAPAVGNIVKVANRDGEEIGEGKIIKVIDSVKNYKTKVIFIAVPKGYGDEVRAIVRE
jgi:Fe-S-cluster-containing hydrogenase component 2